MFGVTEFINYCILFQIILLSKDGFNWSKETVKAFIIVQKIIFQIKVALFFLFVKTIDLHKNVEFNKLIIFDIDNNKKCFLSSKSAF